MPAYTVKAVKQIANGGESGKEWTRQKVRLIDAAGEMTDATLFCNRFTPVPKEGDSLDGTIEPAKQEGWLPELKLPRKGGGGFQGGPRPEDPKTRASIAMQASQKVAVDLAKFAFENNLDADQKMALMALHRDFSQMTFAQVMEAQAKA